MTIEKYIKEIDRRAKEIEQGRPVEIAAKDTSAKMSKRIFEKGLKANGRKIGTYNSTDEFWADPDRAPRSTTKIGKTGKTIKGGYYKSYKAFRQQQGRESSFVNLRLTGQLQSDFNNSRTGVAKPEKRGNEWVIRLKNRANVEKKVGLENKYGNIFDVTKGEDGNFKKVYLREALKTLRGG